MKHENFKNIIQVLHKHKIILENSVEQFVNKLVCDDRRNDCFFRSCSKCKENEIVKNLNNYSPSDVISYYQWVTVKEERINPKNKKKYNVTRTVKKKCSTTIDNFLEIFQSQSDAMLAHVQNIIHHYQTTSNMKQNLNENQALIHVDFSENYSCKYATEVQSVHFGASRNQISLHTGMFYTKNHKQGFATVSDTLDHGSYAIIAHIQPVIEHFLAQHPNIDELFFVSDSTCGQYRNRNTFYLLTQYMTNIFPQLSKVVWSFSEAGHGKGPADGIGAVIKRYLDDLVKYGKDISDLQTLLSALEKKINNLFFCNIPTEAIE